MNPCLCHRGTLSVPVPSVLDMCRHVVYTEQAYLVIPGCTAPPTDDSMLGHCFRDTVWVKGLAYGSVSEAVVVGAVDPFMATLAKFRQNVPAQHALVATGARDLYVGRYATDNRDRLLEYVRGLFALGHHRSDLDAFPRIRFVSLFPSMYVRHRIESVLVRYPVLCEWICSHVSVLSADDLDNITRLPLVYLFIVANRLRVSSANSSDDRALQAQMGSMSIAGKKQFLRSVY